MGFKSGACLYDDLYPCNFGCSCESCYYYTTDDADEEEEEEDEE